MERVILGSSGINVSKICFGTLTMGYLQRNFTISQAAPVVAHAIECGIDFFDTAQYYKTYDIVREALRIKKDAVVSTKSYAYDRSGAQEALEEALRGIGRDYVDIFLMHEQESEHTIRGHYEALEYYMKARAEGKIRALGLSTHMVSGVRGANLYKELEIVHPMLNYVGHGIVDGSLAEMEAAVRESKALNKGVMAMKAFGGGFLLADRKKALDYIIQSPLIDSVAIGMQSIEEIDSNVAFFSGDTVKDAPLAQKSVNVMSWCVGCGACKERCKNNAITITDGKAVIDKSKCVMCAYCGGACKELAIKVY